MREDSSDSADNRTRRRGVKRKILVQKKTQAKRNSPAKPTPPKDPPRFKWRRPFLQGHKCTINLYVRDTIVGKVRCVLKEKCGEEALSRFRSGCFGHLLDLNKRADSANIALHELLARELEDTSFGSHERWFHVGGTDIRFSVNEYALVTGLNFGPSSFDPNVFHEIPANGIYHNHFKGKTRVSQLLEAFEEHNLGNDTEDYLKAANLLFYYQFLLCRGDVWIDDWAWALVEDMASWEIFPWGAYSFQYLCHSFQVLPLKPKHIKNNRRAYHFCGPVWAFQIWAYEAIPKLGNLCGRRDTDLRIPRCLMWRTHVSSADYTTFYDKQITVHRELIPIELEATTVYMRSLKNDPLAVEFVCSKRFTKTREDSSDEEDMAITNAGTHGHVSMHAQSTRNKRMRYSLEDMPGKPSSGTAATNSNSASRHEERSKKKSTGEDLDLRRCNCGKTNSLNVEEMATRVAQAVVHKLEDESETGLIARVAQKVFELLDARDRRMQEMRPSQDEDMLQCNSVPITRPPKVEEEEDDEQEDEEEEETENKATCSTFGCNSISMSEATNEHVKVKRSSAVTKRVGALTENPALDSLHLLWKELSEFELSEPGYEKTKAFFERLLNPREQLKLWISYAKFEESCMKDESDLRDKIKCIKRVRAVLHRGLKHLTSCGPEFKAETEMFQKECTEMVNRFKDNLKRRRHA